MPITGKRSLNDEKKRGGIAGELRLKRGVEA